MPIGPCCAVADVDAERRAHLLELAEHLPTRGEREDGARRGDGLEHAAAEPDPRHLLRGRQRLRPGRRTTTWRRRRRSCRPLVGKPVRVQLMRWDEHGWGHYGPVADATSAAGGRKGKLVAVEYTQFVIPYFTTNGSQQQVTGDGSIDGGRRSTRRSAAPQYGIPNRRAIGKALPLQDNYFKTTFLRAPSRTGSVRRRAAVRRAGLRGEDGSVRVPAEEHRHGDEPGPDVPCAGRTPSRAWRSSRTGSQGGRVDPLERERGQGSRHRVRALRNTRVAAVAEIEVNKKTGKITRQARLRRVGRRLRDLPRRLHNNDEGAVIQGVSRVPARADHLQHEAHHEPRLGHLPDDPLQGRAEDHASGAVADGRADQRHDARSRPAARARRVRRARPRPGPPAIANAFFDATGVRIREAPMSPARVRQLLAAAGK